MTEPDETPDVPDVAEPKSAGPKNEQFASLNRLRRERTWVDVYLIGGTCLHGQIRSFDASMMLLQTRSGDIGLYHHAISTVVRAQKRGTTKRRHVGGPGMAAPPRVLRGEPRYDSRPDSRSDSRPDPRGEPRARPDLPPRRYDEPSAEPSDEPVRRPAERAPVVIVKQRRTRTFVKPD